jgi:hypothetical protein
MACGQERTTFQSACNTMEAGRRIFLTFNLRNIRQATNTKSKELSAQRSRNRFPDRSLAYTRRSNKTQYLAYGENLKS